MNSINKQDFYRYIENRTSAQTYLPYPFNQDIVGSGKPLAKHWISTELPSNAEISCGSIVHCGATNNKGIYLSNIFLTKA